MSSATVVSSDEADEPMEEIDEERLYIGWVTYLSEKTCGHCAGVGVVC